MNTYLIEFRTELKVEAATPDEAVDDAVNAPPTLSPSDVYSVLELVPQAPLRFEVEWTRRGNE